MRAELEIEFSDLEPGERRRVLCPQCEGGSSRERSFSVSRSDDGALLFMCFRAACGFRGVIGASPTATVRLAAKPSRLIRIKRDPSERFVPFEQAGFRDPGGWNEFGVEFDPDTCRYAIPVYSPIDGIRGYVLRHVVPSRDGSPKVLAVPTVPEPQLGWNKQRGTDVVVVEDIPSAILLGRIGVRAVALNGTHMTDEARDELIAEAENVVFALDRDAYAKALKMEADMRIHFRQTACLLLERDFKNQTPDEARKCLSDLCWQVFCTPESPSRKSADSSAPN